jgi:DNA-binding CsgD family transcriptional regulator/pimeloyl-ACP methyl ester carboxylesterase
MEDPQIQFLDNEGVRIAYWTLGSGPPLMILSGEAGSNIQGELRFGPSRRFYEGLAERWQVIRYDSRLAGLSDRSPDSANSADHLSDLRAVIAITTSAPVTLFAAGVKAPYAVQYSAEKPERVAHLILWHPNLNSADFAQQDFVQAWLTMTDVAYETVVEAMADMYLRPQPDEREALLAMALQGSSSEGDKRFWSESVVDGTQAAAAVTTPTTVMTRNAGGHLDITFAQSQEAERDLPTARLLILPGESASPYLGDSQPVIDAIDATLPSGDAASPPAPVPSFRDEASDGLSKRELEVLRLVAQGRRNRDIGEALVISPATVTRHISNILAKTGLTNRTELARYAAQRGLAEEDAADR